MTNTISDYLASHKRANLIQIPLIIHKLPRISSRFRQEIVVLRDDLSGFVAWRVTHLKQRIGKDVFVIFFLVEMRVKGHLKEWFNDYFGGLQLNYNEDGSCTLTGKLEDSAAFYGLILTLRDSGVELLSLEARKMR